LGYPVFIPTFSVDEDLHTSELDPIISEPRLNAEVQERVQISCALHSPDAGAELNPQRQFAAAVQFLIDP
jgi:hypothetical protein